MIVIEDTDGTDFNIYLAGDIDRLLQQIPESKMTPAEYWAKQLFKTSVDVLKKTGVLNNVPEGELN